MTVKRNHELHFGERVYDSDTLLIYHIVALNLDGSVELAMTDGDIACNKELLEREVYWTDHLRTTTNPDALYQFAPDLVARDGNEVCYEHHKLGDYDEEGGDYPYYSPYLDENLYGFETFKLDEWESR